MSMHITLKAGHFRQTDDSDLTPQIRPPQINHNATREMELTTTANANIQTTGDTTVSYIYRAALTSIWFTGPINSYESVRARRDLTPEGALCLLIMVTEDVASATGIQMFLHPFGGGDFDRIEAKILAETALYSLLDNKYLRLDAKGKRELAAHDNSYYGLKDIQWLLTAKAARAMASAYCICKGKGSPEQEEAVKVMLSTNKAVVAKNREHLSKGKVA